MLFEDIVSRVMSRMNLTSTEAQTRVEENVNVWHHHVTSSMGLDTSRNITVTATTVVDATDVVFENVEKVQSVWYPSDAADPESQPIVLSQVTQDQLLNSTKRTSGMPRAYAVVSMAGTAVTIQLDTLMAEAIDLYAHAVAVDGDMVSGDEPQFPASFHDILVEGACADEYKKMEKRQLGVDAEQRADRRTADLRMFLAKNMYLLIRQGGAPRSDRARTTTQDLI